MKSSTEGCRFTVAALAILGAALPTACRTGPEAEIDPLSVERVVTKAPANAARAPAVDEVPISDRAEAELAAAQAAWQSGDPLTALAIVNKALVEGVPSELSGAFRDLRAKARASVVTTKICRVRAVPEKDVVADGTAVPVTIEFANVSSGTLRVPRSLAGSSAAVVILTLVRQDFDVFGNQRETEYTLSVPVQKDLTLEPGQSERTRLTIPAEMTTLAHQGFSVMELRGTFRPVVLRVGDSEFFDAIPIETARLRIFLKGFEPLAEDPLGSLKKAVAKRSPPHILTAVELLPPADRGEAATFLEAAKTADPDLTVVVDASLARLVATR